VRYGHFGREEDGFSWERLDLIEKLKDRVGQLKSGV
jgi:S-adenosylmethionine synthetase